MKNKNRLALLLLAPFLAHGGLAHADSLTGKAPKDTYRDLLQMSNANAGIDTTLRPVLDGKGTPSIFSLSTTAARLAGPLDFGGTGHAGLTLNRLTNAQRDALTPLSGMMIFNTTSGRVESYDGSAWVASGTGSVSAVSVVSANGISGSVANATSTPAITLALGAITPTSIAASGTVTGTNLSGTNTGDQTITLGGDVTGSGTGVISATVTKINGQTPATVATTGAYADLTGKPTLGTAAAQNSTAFATASQGTKADTALQAASNLSDLANTATARVNLGLGTAATSGAGAFATSAQGTKADTALQAANNLTDLANATTALTNLLPSQTGNAGKFLTTSGSAVSWSAAIPSSTFAGLPSAASAGATAMRLVTDYNAVFISDGTIWKPLGGKLVIAASGAAINSSITTETAMATVTIPAGLMTANGSLVVTSLWSIPNNANAKILRLRLGGTGGTAYMNLSLAGGNLTFSAQHVIRNRGAMNSQVGGSTTAVSYGTQTSAVVTGAIDMTASQTLLLTGQTATGGDTITLEGYTVELQIP